MDRNTKKSVFYSAVRLLSLSARRAWIEIGIDFAEDWLNAVALRKESVDRNNLKIIYRPFRGVALRKESVDRNIRPTPTSQTS